MKTNSLLHGAHCFFAGISLIFQPGLRRFVIVPLLINLVLFGLASWLLWHYLSTTVDSMLPSWLTWLAWLILPVFMLSVLTIVYYTFTLLANIIAAPFYGQLAKAVEARLRGLSSLDDEVTLTFKYALQMLSSELRKLCYYLLRAIPLLLLSLIPGLNVITLPLWMLFSAWFLTFEYTGYTFENHKILFAEQKRMINQSRFSSVIFGSCSLVATTIPVINLFAPAIAVAGSAKLLYERGDLD
ncbi:MAG: sulfate transporter CysZ [Cycloclasticus sp.]|nr:sulfate transporter CysZ [Cycloclasticus sp.]